MIMAAAAPNLQYSFKPRRAAPCIKSQQGIAVWNAESCRPLLLLVLLYCRSCCKPLDAMVLPPPWGRRLLGSTIVATVAPWLHYPFQHHGIAPCIKQAPTRDCNAERQIMPATAVAAAAAAIAVAGTSRSTFAGHAIVP